MGRSRRSSRKDCGTGGSRCGSAWRPLSYPMVIRLVIAMTLLPGSSYAEAARVLAGLLADVPFTLGWHVPTGKMVGEWRMLIPPEIMQEVFWHVAGALIGDG